MNYIRPNALCIFSYKDKTLVCHGFDNQTGEKFYRLLGGGIEIGEKSSDTIKREIKEELGFEICDIKKLITIENIFQYNGQQSHEITFLYKGKFMDKDVYTKDTLQILDKENYHAEWVSISDIKNKKIILYPKEAIDYL